MSFEKLLLNYLNQSNISDFSTDSKLFSLEYTRLIAQFVNEKSLRIVDSVKNNVTANISSDSKFKHGQHGDQQIAKSTKQNASTGVVVNKVKIQTEINKHGSVAESRFKALSHKKDLQNVKNDMQKSVNVTSTGTHQCRPANNASPNSISQRQPLQSYNKFSNKTSHVDPDKIDHRFDISSSSDFPLLLNSSSPGNVKKAKDNCQKQNRRRIKPTIVSKDRDVSKASAFNSHSSDLLNVASSSLDADITAEQKSLLSARFCNSRKFVSATPQGVKVKVLSKHQNHVKGVAQTSSQSHQQTVATSCFDLQMKRLAEIHSYSIKHCLVPSIIAEIHLLISLLFLEYDNQLSSVDAASSVSNDTLDTILNSPEKAWYFASACILQLSQDGYLQLFSTETLNLLLIQVENKSNMLAFVKSLKEEINKRTTQQSSENNAQYQGSLRTAVPFKPETDDRSNFHCDRAFFSFRKQRDMFYKLLREWDKDTGKFLKETIGQIRWLISQVKAQSTFDAFLRLFVDQLLSIVRPSESGSNSFGDNFPVALLLNGDTEKFRRLESRVSKASPSQKSNSCDWKYREFQFFRDFVTISDSYAFNTHLCDYLQFRISQIEKDHCQIDDATDESDIQNYNSIVQAIYDLRILGNFYGLLVFLPNQDGTKKKENLSHIERACGEFLLASLNRSVENGHLLLTLPWIIQFLYFSSPVLTSTDLFNRICELLLSIYRLKEVNTLSVKISTILHLFIVTVISTLFEQEFFNDDVFYQHLNTNLRVKYECPLNSVDAASNKILTSKLICEMHWRLSDIRNSLKNKSSLSKRQLPKKITPSTEKLPDDVNVQAKLEAAFFRNQPLSMKRTVTFVSDRCHSNCVKYLLSDVVPKFCQDCLVIKEFVQEKSEEKDNKAVKILANEVYSEATRHLKEKVAKYVEKNSLKCMDALVSTTTSKQVLRTATEIAERMALKNVETWLSGRLLDHLCSNIKLLLFDQKVDSEQLCPSDRTIQTSCVIHNLRESIISCQSNPENETEIKDIVIEQLLVVSKLLAFHENTPGSLPRHIMPVLAYLIRELITCTKSIDCEEFLRFSSLENCRKTILLNLIHDF